MKKFIALLLSVVCLFSLCAVPAFAEETNPTIDYVDRNVLSMTIDGEVCWCVNRNAVMPDEGYVYEGTEFECPERLLKVAVAIKELDNGEDKFHTAGQYAVWQCYESTNMVMYSTVIEGEEVGNYVKQILDYADAVNLEDYEVVVNFYGYVSGDTEQSEYGYQEVATFKVSKKGEAPVEPEIPDEPDEPEIPETPEEPENPGKTEIPDIIIDGEEYFCIEKDKTIPDAEDTYVIDEDYVVSDRFRQLAVVVSENEYSHEAIVCAVWSVVSENDITEELKGMLSEEGFAEFNEIMSLIDDVDIEKYDIEITIYKPVDECKQKLAQFSAKLKEVEPEIPDEPEVPEEPENPVDPDEPTEPDVPVEPDEPTDPETPETPEEPTDPDTPAEPEDPETPVEPEKPTEPEKPSEPEKPADPKPETPKEEVSGDGYQDNPQTGDDFNLALWVSLAAISFAGIVVLTLTRKKYHKI